MRVGFGMLGFVAVLFLIGVSGAEAQRGWGGGGMRGGEWGRGNSEQMEQMRDQIAAMRALPVDEMWAALSLGMTLSDDQMAKLKPMMADAWKQRKDMLEAARKDGTWSAAKDQLENLKKTLDAEVKALLTKDQQKTFKDLTKQQAPPEGPRRF